jgi:hypothetical protein
LWKLAEWGPRVLKQTQAITSFEIPPNIEKGVLIELEKPLAKAGLRRRVVTSHY